MAKEISKTQIDRLGNRLKKGNISEDDLRLLDQYRRSFTDSYEVIVGSIRKELGLEPTGRPAKSTTSISDKLRRESIRLTQIQDIAGCRLIVTDIANQESVVQSLRSLFEETIIIDRRERPSHGYRAVHVVVKHSGKLIEVQIRTSHQQLWAELSEKDADIVDPAIKYGGGNKEVKDLLTEASDLVGLEEILERKITRVLTISSSIDDLSDDTKQEIDKLLKAYDSIRKKSLNVLRKLIERVQSLKGERNDISD